MAKSLRVVGLFVCLAFLFRKVMDFHGRMEHLLQSTLREAQYGEHGALQTLATSASWMQSILSSGLPQLLLLTRPQRLTVMLM